MVLENFSWPFWLETIEIGLKMTDMNETEFRLQPTTVTNPYKLQMEYAWDLIGQKEPEDDGQMLNSMFEDAEHFVRSRFNDATGLVVSGGFPRSELRKQLVLCALSKSRGFTEKTLGEGDEEKIALAFMTKEQLIIFTDSMDVCSIGPMMFMARLPEHVSVDGLSNDRKTLNLTVTVDWPDRPKDVKKVAFRIDGNWR